MEANDIKFTLARLVYFAKKDANSQRRGYRSEPLLQERGGSKRTRSLEGISAGTPVPLNPQCRWIQFIHLW